MEDLLPEAQQGTAQLEMGLEEEETTQIITKDFKVLQAESSVENSATLNGSEFSEEEFLALAKLDDDLSQFEEDESRIINNQNGGQFPKREKSSIPTFRSATSKAIGKVEGEPNGSPITEYKAFVPTIQKETSHARVSAIPRFSTSSSVEEKIPEQSLIEGDDVAAALSSIVENELREEKQVNARKGWVFSYFLFLMHYLRWNLKVTHLLLLLTSILFWNAFKFEADDIK